MIDISSYNRVISILLANPDARQAVLYLGEHRTVKATRRGSKFHHRGGQAILTFAVTDGPPNYRERQVIKRERKAGRRWPMEEIEVR